MLLVVRTYKFITKICASSCMILTTDRIKWVRDYFQTILERTRLLRKVLASLEMGEIPDMNNLHTNEHMDFLDAMLTKMNNYGMHEAFMEVTGKELRMVGFGIKTPHVVDGNQKVPIFDAPDDLVSVFAILVAVLHTDGDEYFNYRTYAKRGMSVRDELHIEKPDMHLSKGTYRKLCVVMREVNALLREASRKSITITYTTTSSDNVKTLKPAKLALA